MTPYHSLDPSAQGRPDRRGLGGGPRRRPRALREPLRAAAAGPALTAGHGRGDDGGSSGRPRNHLGALPPGDLRMALGGPVRRLPAGLHLERRDAAPLQHRGAPGRGMDNHAGAAADRDPWEAAGRPRGGTALGGGPLGARGQAPPMSCTPLVTRGRRPGQQPHGRRPRPSRAQSRGRRASPRRRNVRQRAAEPGRRRGVPGGRHRDRGGGLVVPWPRLVAHLVLPHLLLPQLRDAICASPPKRLVTLNLSRDSETLSMGSGTSCGCSSAMPRSCAWTWCSRTRPRPSPPRTWRPPRHSWRGALAFSLRDKDGGSVHNPFNRPRPTSRS
ncbi:2-phospho-L-lactate transferase [Kocuria rhizophila]|nr:2-phospho-L-lactate transferase [Kocuria rhizophila]